MQKRLFFGLRVDSPWPESTPEGRLINPSFRHITLSFLGNVEIERLIDEMDFFPPPPFLVGPVGISEKILFLPEKTPRVVAEQVRFLSYDKSIVSYQKTLLNWLERIGYKVDRRPLLNHVTLARAPFENDAWIDAFEPLPYVATGIHLYESLGNLQYKSLFAYPLTPAFEEFEHTADIAFHIRGKNPNDLYLHGAIAMSFKYPPFLEFLEMKEQKSLDQVVRGLNKMISECDAEYGCPFKALSYHGNIKEEDGLYNWEMIIDV